MISELYNDKKAIWEWLHNGPQAYKRWLMSMQEAELKTLKHADDMKHVHRAQGRLEILDRLIGLEHELLKEVR